MAGRADIAAARAHYRTLKDNVARVAFADTLTHKQFSAIIGEEIADNLNANVKATTEGSSKSS